MDPLDAYTLECCAAPAIERRPRAKDVQGRECVQLRCTRCGAERPVYLRHFAYQMRHTACLLELDGSRRSATLDPAAVDCPDCLWMLVHEFAQPPVPDWRAAQALGEDHYAA
jgi:hypothetical protein